MFTSESELVEKLVKDLEDRYGISYIVRELRSGNNIADVAFTTNIEREHVVFDEYLNAYYYFHNMYNRKKLRLEEIEIRDTRASKKFNRFLSDLEELGYIKICGNYITTIKKVDAVTKNLIAIEAKLSDWKAGLEQALRYKQFANEVYIALSKDYIERVDANCLREHGVGLMSVSEGMLKIPIRPKKKKVEQLEIQFYIADRFLKQLKFESSVLASKA